MTFEEIVQILQDKSRTDYQRAADIHAALTKASTPSAFNVKPDKQRKKPEKRKPSPPIDLLDGQGGQEGQGAQ